MVHQQWLDVGEGFPLLLKKKVPNEYTILCVLHHFVAKKITG